MERFSVISMTSPRKAVMSMTSRVQGFAGAGALARSLQALRACVTLVPSQVRIRCGGNKKASPFGLTLLINWCGVQDSNL